MTKVERPGSPLRPAEAGDEKRILEWRNNPWIVSLGTNRRPVSPDEHAAWFRSVLGSPNRLLFIIESDEGTPAGTVRLDRESGAAAVLTIYLTRSFTGRGLGPRAIEAACRAAFRDWPAVGRIIARIRADNVPSRKAFERSGFVLDLGGGPCPEGHVEMVRGRDAPTSAVWNEDDRENARLYDALVEQYGGGPRALDWGGAESQRLRFEVLAAVAPLRGASVLDVGCGLGDFCQWATDADMEVRYTGIDIAPRMVEAARRRLPTARFELCNLLEAKPPDDAYDYVLASGVFAKRRRAPSEFMNHLAGLMFGLCRKAVAFNSLSAWAPDQEAGEFYADPAATLAFCRTLTPRVVLRHDYHPRDFTLYLYKGGAR
jgi:RimJ/RimL family protein N-acetyltransferase/SAM-dependent methyltransferase